MKTFIGTEGASAADNKEQARIPQNSFYSSLWADDRPSSPKNADESAFEFTIIYTPMRQWALSQNILNQSQEKHVYCFS